MKKTILYLLFLLFSSFVYAETVILNDGTTYKGNIHLQNEENVYIVQGDDLIKLDDGITNVVRVIPSSNIKGERYVSVLQRKEISFN